MTIGDAVIANCNTYTLSKDLATRSRSSLVLPFSNWFFPLPSKFQLANNFTHKNITIIKTVPKQSPANENLFGRTCRYYMTCCWGILGTQIPYYIIQTCSAIHTSTSSRHPLTCSLKKYNLWSSIIFHQIFQHNLI